MALLDVVVASVILLIVLLPAAQLLSTDAKVVGNSRGQAIAQGEASLQLAQDRAAWTSTSASPTFQSSPSCGSAYSASTVNATFNLYLTGCQNVSGMPLWIFQNGGWCYTNGSTLGSSGTGVPMYWVEIMVTWGGNLPPPPSAVVSATSGVVITSALQTPSGYTGSTSGGCPL
jgi:Tfp pilus assembly protein PilX